MPVVWYFEGGSDPIMAFDTRFKRVDAYPRTRRSRHDIAERIRTLDPIHFPYCMTSFVRQINEISEIMMVGKWQKSARSGCRDPK